MELSVIYSRALSGIDAPLVEVETHLSNGLPAFNIVGLPETAVRESKDRVRSAILNSHFTFPDRRITVNLAPADLPKEGGRFDLPIALGILSASGQIPQDSLAQHEFLAELALDGSLRPVPGVVAAAIAASSKGRQLVVATACAPAAAIVPGSRVISAPDILTLCAHLNGREKIEAMEATGVTATMQGHPDLSDVAGQEGARRALEIAAAGGHNLLLWGYVRPTVDRVRIRDGDLPRLVRRRSTGQRGSCQLNQNTFERYHSLNAQTKCDTAKQQKYRP